MFDLSGEKFNAEEQKAYDAGGINAALRVWKKNQKEADKKAREAAKKKRQAAAQAGVSINKLDDLQEELASYGAQNSATTVQYYSHAKQEIPSLTTKQYTQKLHEIGGEDYKIAQKEMLHYFDTHNLTDSERTQLWKAYGNWSTIPVLKKNGTWGTKKAK
jgi:predicted transcriptional regulator